MSDVSRAACIAVAKFITDNTSGITVYPEWPGANEPIALPAVSVTCSAPTFTKCSPYLLSTGATTDHKAPTKYTVGQYDFTIQLDIWARYKIQRSTLYQQIFEAFHSSLDGSSIVTLSDYHNQLCGLTEIGHRLPDDSELSSRQEWRVIIEYDCSCNAVVSRSDYIITQPPEATVSTPSFITEE